MPSETAEILQLRVPPNDGAISSALAELESKLSAWVSSASAVHENLAHRSGRVSQVEKSIADRREQLAEFEKAVKARVDSMAADRIEAPPALPDVPEESVGDGKKAESTVVIVDQPPGRRAPAEKRAERAVDKGSIAAAKPVVAAGEDRKAYPDDKALLESLEMAMANTIRQRHQDCKGRKSIRDLIAEYEKEMDEAEALLDSLPNEVAADIRVQFRFYNGRKSIKQLMEEYRAEPGAEKHSWWKKVKG